MSVNSEFYGYFFFDIAHGALDIFGERAAVRIAKDNFVCSCITGGFKNFQRILTVTAPTVKEMFGIEKDISAVIFEEFYAVVNYSEVFFKGRFEDIGDMKIPCFSEDRAVIRKRGKELEYGIVFGSFSCMTGPAESDDL